MAILAFTKTGTKSTSKVTLPKSVFAVDVTDQQLLKEVYLAQTGNQRQVIASIKNRSAVRGGGRKPWRQKGTGRARAGTIRSPLWRGGGVVFGPSSNRNFSQKINSQSRSIALKQALTLAAKDNRIIIIDAIEASGKTKDLAKLLAKLDFNRGLIVVDELTEALKLAVRNIQNIDVITAAHLSTNKVLSYEQLLVTKPALSVLDELRGAKK